MTFLLSARLASAAESPNAAANIAANEALKVRLLETEGIKEVLIAEEEHSAYVKIDSKVTNRFEIEQAIRQA